MFKVLKKDNTLEDFKPQKIVEAIMKAAFRCDKQIPDETMFAMANSISERLQSRKKVPVAELHELVIGTLATFGFKDVATSYAEYRYYKNNYAKTFEQLRQDADRPSFRRRVRSSRGSSRRASIVSSISLGAKKNSLTAATSTSTTCAT